MNIKKINWWLGSGATYGAVVTAYVSRLTSLGYTAPSATVLSAMDAFFTAIGSTATNKFDILHFFALNNALLQDAASVNIVRPTLSQCSYVNSPTYATDGVMGNGTTSYVDTMFNPGTMGINYLLNTSSRGLWIRTAPNTGTILDGQVSGGLSRNVMSYVSTTAHRINCGGNSLNSAVDLTGTGYTAINRSTSTDVQLYKGAVKSDRTQTSVAVISGNQHVGHNDAGSFSNTKFSMYYMGGNFTEAEHNSINTAFGTYLTAIGL